MVFSHTASRRLSYPATLCLSDRALVLCIDKNGQIQALYRSLACAADAAKQAERRSHDYVRYGTKTLLAALDTERGRVIGECHRRHRSVECRKFLDTIDPSFPADLDVHLVMDNYGTRKAGVYPAVARQPPRRSPKSGQ